MKIVYGDTVITPTGRFAEVIGYTWGAFGA